MKICAQCKQEKGISNFGKDKQQKSGLKPYCKECVKDRWKKNEGYNAQRRERYKKDKDVLIERHRIWENKKRKEDPKYRMRKNLARRINHALRGRSKSQSTLSLLGCSLEFFKNYLESLFQIGMSWDNYGKWEVDHRIPCASFDLTNSKHQLECFNYTNLQPLWRADNLRKSNKICTL